MKSLALIINWQPTSVKHEAISALVCKEILKNSIKIAASLEKR